MDPHLQAFLAERDEPCPGCGYNLRGLAATVCPECRQTLVLRVGLAEPRQAIWIAGLVGLAAGAGFHGLLFLYFIILVARHPHGDALGFFVLTAPSFLAESASLFAWLRWRRRLQRLRPAPRAGLALLGWCLTLAGFAAFAALIR
jgi:hypothetical protein